MGDIMTVPVIVEIIFRFIPSALLVFGFIEINLTAKYNKYIQFIAINTVSYTHLTLPTIA